MDMLGLIFADEHGADIDELTRKRTFAAIPFGARYRLIDFFLSNMTNSGILNIGVFTATKYESLMGHIRYGGEWDLNRRSSGLSVLPPFSFYSQDGEYENSLEAMQANISYLTKHKEKYVLFTCCNAIGNIDYSAMLDYHIRTGARFTCLGTKAPRNKDTSTPSTQYVVDGGGRITEIILKDGFSQGDVIGTDTYIMERKDLLSLLQKTVDEGKNSLRRDILIPAVEDSDVMAYITDETLLYVDSIPSYLKSSLDLLDPKVRFEFFRQDTRPIVTGLANSAPGFYGEYSAATNSLIAAGTVIEGTVKNSVIFRNVHIKKDAVVENSVINQDSTIGSGAHLNYAVLDKGVVINDKRQLSGYITHPFFVQYDSII